MRGLLTLAWVCLAGCVHGDATRPNVVFFLVDDLGYMDIGAYNPNTFYETPHIDELAATGMRFTSGYAANPVCSPTRYSIMAGKYPTRVRATNFFSGARQGRFKPAVLRGNMPTTEVTLAEAFKEAGYKTAFLGKWHLGPTKEFWPEAQGFDVNVGGHSGGMPKSYFSPYSNPRLSDGPKGEHLPKRLGDEAVSLLEGFKSEPFFLYFSFYSVHTPLQARADLTEKYRVKAQAMSGNEFGEEEMVSGGGKGKTRAVRQVQKHATYAAMMESMDHQVGRVLTKLKDLGLDKNTIVCFMSDNGGLSTSEGSPTSNLPLRGGKGWVYEGGIREPFMIRWPGVTAPGSVCDVPVISTDFYPTLLAAAGLGLKPGQHLDGVNLVPLLKGGTSLARKSLFWHYPHYSNQGGFPGGAIREGNFKLVERYEDGRTHLYNLKTDVGERVDLADQNPDRVTDMRTRLHAWYQSVDAQFLRPRGDEQPWCPPAGK